jgi:hypothetical protein
MARCMISLSSGIKSSDLSSLSVLQFYHCTIFPAQWPPHPLPDLPYLRPSFLYPALSKYHLLSGWAQRISQGRFMM